MATTYLPTVLSTSRGSAGLTTSSGLSSTFRASIDKALAMVPAGAKAATVIGAEYADGQPQIYVATAWKSKAGWTVAGYLKTDISVLTDVTAGVEVTKVWL